jgi:hypothetical protein
VPLAWGTDLIRVAGPGAGALFPTGASSAGERWSNELAKQHARSAHVKDPFRLRLNAYRVLLTRGRDAAVVFVPPDPRLDLTAAWLQGHGVKVLD